ncbi:MAG: hypothetical protein QXH26_05175 [Candidatus Hadarchaeales archaeon]
MHRRERRPAVEKRIRDLGLEDTWVRVVGTVTKKGEADFLLQDGEGDTITVFVDEPELLSEVREGSKVRVFGTHLRDGERREIRAEIVQNLKGLDLKLYREAIEEMEKLRKAAGLT